QAGQILGVLEPVRLLLERLLLALLQLRPLDLLGLEAEEIGALLDLATPAVEVLERAACADEPVVCRPRLRSQRFGPREGVQDRTLLIGSEQRLVLVLAVQVDEPAPDLAKDRRRRRGPVDPRAVPPLGGDFAAQDDEPVLRL